MQVTNKTKFRTMVTLGMREGDAIFGDTQRPSGNGGLFLKLRVDT